ncbi:hypothetical protein EVAR_52018_1 [Eumeta japonica]|uniref:Uncharacterized protein n=1 Tax=Eumeta variegata TaxID=151549 RepID=A0A4C1YWG0_EUMVA|nr:hypothetical protein EVAR_52018_1 [Eumeta japonica]
MAALLRSAFYGYNYLFDELVAPPASLTTAQRMRHGVGMQGLLNATVPTPSSTHQPTTTAPSDSSAVERVTSRRTALNHATKDRHLTSHGTPAESSMWDQGTGSLANAIYVAAVSTITPTAPLGATAQPDLSIAEPEPPRNVEELPLQLDITPTYSTDPSQHPIAPIDLR